MATPRTCLISISSVEATEGCLDENLAAATRDVSATRITDACVGVGVDEDAAPIFQHK